MKENIYYNQSHPETIYSGRKFSEKETLLAKQLSFNAIGLHNGILGIRDSRARAMALTKLEEAIMWANKAICANGLFNTPAREKE